MPKMNQVKEQSHQVARWFMLGCAAIIVLRVGLWSFAGLSVDMGAWQAWIGRLYTEGPWHFYTETMWTHYTPGSLLFLWLYGLVFHGLFGVPLYTQFFEVAIKFFSTGFDIGAAYLIFQIVKKHSTKQWAYLASFLYLANPGVIFNTSVWGQFDGLLTFFLLAAFFLLYEKRKLFSATILLAFCLLIKPQAIAFFPVFGLTALILFGRKKTVSATLVALGFFFVISAIFFPTSPITETIGLYTKMAADYPFTSLNAFNIWAIFGWWASDQDKVFGLAKQTWGTLLYLVSVGVVIIPILKSIKHKVGSLPPTTLYTSLTLSGFFLFIFLTRMHERYLLPVFGFFIIVTCLRRSIMLLVAYLVTAFIHLANLWYVYYTFNVLNNHVEANQNILFPLVQSHYRFLSFLTCIIAAGITVAYYKKAYAQN